MARMSWRLRYRPAGPAGSELALALAISSFRTRHRLRDVLIVEAKVAVASLPPLETQICSVETR